MKKKNIFIMMALMAVVAMGLMGCVKKKNITVSTQNLFFGLEASSQTLSITANCEWMVTKNDEADWYTISAMSGKKDGTLTISVEAMENADFRESTFVISSLDGQIKHTVFISQNKIDFDGLVNKIFGVMSVEHWNTDYFGQIIEDSYKHKEYNPHDTATGYQMYFLEDGVGIQRDRHNDMAVYYIFNYEYNPANQILHIEFETVSGAPENYDPQVLTASDSLYRFIHEYKANWWERADMRRIGTINPSEKAIIKSVATKRKGDEPIFQF